MTKKTKYFIKTNQSINVCGIDYFDTIKNWNQAFSIAVSCYVELQNTLLKDCTDKKDSYIGSIKVTTGLERALQEIGNRFPGVLSSLHSSIFNIQKAKS